jgi:hypothetical protein
MEHERFNAWTILCPAMCMSTEFSSAWVHSLSSAWAQNSALHEYRVHSAWTPDSYEYAMHEYRVKLVDIYYAWVLRKFAMLLLPLLENNAFSSYTI